MNQVQKEVPKPWNALILELFH